MEEGIETQRAPLEEVGFASYEEERQANIKCVWRHSIHQLMTGTTQHY